MPVFQNVKRTTALAALLLAATLGTACGSGSGTSTAPAEPAVRTTATTTERNASEPADESEPQASGVLTAVARGNLPVFDAPDGAPTMSLSATTSLGSVRTLLVASDQGEWLDVLLPVRPNGTHGFVRRADVDLRRVDTSIVVDLASRTLTATSAGAVVLSSPVAIGSPENPTPTGTHYVTDLIATGDASSAYGPFALGLSAHSDTLTEFAGGDGQVGIHGTDDPSSIGHDVSHGCVRLPNDVVSRLAAMLPLGTPVVIR